MQEDLPEHRIITAVQQYLPPQIVRQADLHELPMYLRIQEQHKTPLEQEVHITEHQEHPAVIATTQIKIHTEAAEALLPHQQ